MRIGLLHGLDVDRTLHHARGPVLLVVTKPGCGACRALKAALAGTPDVDRLAAWEVDATGAPALVEELALFHLPALWLFVDGEPAEAIAAPPDPARLSAALADAIARHT
ncbi:MAG: thioredoxin domain-containing protein [Myxococcota bacterium]